MQEETEQNQRYYVEMNYFACVKTFVCLIAAKYNFVFGREP